MKPITKLIFAFMAATLLQSHVARADEVYTFVVKKQEEKQQKRWNLSEWLETRDKMRLMDLWLALHSPAPYEFYIGGDYRVSDSAVTSLPVVSSGRSFRLSAAAYASIFGLEAQRRFAPGDEWLGLFNLRVFGYHAQSTNITLQAGVRSRGPAIAGATSTRNAVFGVASSIYLNRHFGLDGDFRHQFMEVPNSAGLQRSGNTYEAGAFIDFSYFRVYGHYFHEAETDEVTAAESARKGAQVGVRLWF